MNKEATRNYKQNEIDIVPFPPLPVQSIRLPHAPSQSLTPMIAGIVGTIGLISALVFAVPWQSLYTQVSLHPRYKQTKSIKFLLPKTPAAEETPAIGEFPPPSRPTFNPNLLVGRYPVRKYTNIRHTILATDYLVSLVREYRDTIFPKRYRDYKALARHNRIRPPKYVLITGAEFLIPTAEHIVLPKIGDETELQQIQSELANLPGDAALLNRLGVIHFRRNELDKAKIALQQGIKLSPDNSTLHNNLGFIFLILEEDTKAKDELKFAIAHSEHPHIPRCNLGTLYMTTGKLDSAIKAFKSALEAEPNLPDAKYNLALAHEKGGRVNLAKELLYNLTQILPDDTEVKLAFERLNPDNVAD